MSMDIVLSKPKSLSINQKSAIIIALLVPVFTAMIWLHYRYIPTGGDWYLFYGPAIRSILSGSSPYVRGFYNPPWLLAVFIPIAGLNWKLATAVFCVVSFASFGYIAFLLELKPINFTLFVLSPQILYTLYNATTDWIVALGFFLPPRIGMFFVLIKPQIGLPIALFWIIQAWRSRGWKEVARILAPVAIVTVLSFAVFGFWPANGAETVQKPWNASLFPWTLPAGVIAIVYSVVKKRSKIAWSAGPLVSPYLAPHSWLFLALAGVHSKIYMLVFFTLSWFLWAITGWAFVWLYPFTP